MQEHLPVPAFPSKAIVPALRRGGAKASVDRALAIKHVFYAGDEAGLVCDVTPGRDAKTVVVVSLTHLRICSGSPTVRSHSGLSTRARATPRRGGTRTVG